MLRDGIEDYEYFAMLERLLQTKGSRLNATERKEFAALLEVPREITSGMKSFNTDPTPLKSHRIKLAEAIERLQKL